MKKIWIAAIASTLVLTTPLVAASKEVHMGFVNFKECLEKSKQGRQEQQAFDALKNQMQETLESTDKELGQLAMQLEDQDHLDSLSPTAEEELKQKFHGLSQEFQRYQAQYYQLLNQANYKMFQSLHEKVSVAAAKVRENANLSMILNEESVFSIAPMLDVTEDVVAEMDRLYDMENDEIAQLSKTSGTKSYE